MLKLSSDFFSISVTSVVEIAYLIELYKKFISLVSINFYISKCIIEL